MSNLPGTLLCICLLIASTSGQSGCIDGQGVEHEVGSKYTDGCKTCKCQRGPTANCKSDNCPATCSIFTERSYLTFDAKAYTFSGSCRYIIAKDCCQNQFSIESISQSRERDGKLIWSKGYLVKTGNRQVEVLRNQIVYVNGKLLSDSGNPSYEDKTITVATNGPTVIVTLNKLGVTLSETSGFQLEIEIPPEFRDGMCGLCGNADGKTGNEFTDPLGQKHKTAITFADSWMLSDNVEGCDTGTVAIGCENMQAKRIAMSTCVPLWNNPFKKCHDTVNVFGYAADCEFDVCLCGFTHECLCPSLEVYYSACTDAGVKVSTSWRNDYGCKKPCVYEGVKYADGDTWRVKCNTCSCSDGEVACTEEDCEGICDLWGDPHYTSFDGRRFDYQGDCRYVLTKDCESNNFIIEIDQRLTSPASTVAISWSFTIKIGDSIYHLHRNHKFYVGADLIPTPFSDSEVDVSTEGNTIKMLLKTYSITLTWAANHHAQVFASPTYFDQLCGLCGNYNNDQSDDFIGADNIEYPTATLFGDTWIVPSDPPEECSITTINDQLPCDRITVDEMNVVTERCSILKDSPFKTCADKISVTPYLSMCETELCDCGVETTDCICTTIAAWVRECDAGGYSIPGSWKAMYGCGGVCYQNGHEYRSGDSWKFDCNTCTCSDSVITCTTQACAGVCDLWGDPHYTSHFSSLL